MILRLTRRLTGRVKGVDWDFGGELMSIKWLLALCYRAGFRGPNLAKAASIAWAESGRWTGAWNINLRGTEDESTDRGLFQVNDKWHGGEDRLPGDNVTRTGPAYEPIPNALYAFQMSQGEHFGPWMSYTSGRYLLYMPLVQAVRATTDWKARILKVERRWS